MFADFHYFLFFTGISQYGIISFTKKQYNKVRKV